MHKEEIEAHVSMPLSWNRKDDKMTSSIDFILNDLDYSNQDSWSELSSFHAKMSKELADFIFYPYEQEIRDFISRTERIHIITK